MSLPIPETEFASLNASSLIIDFHPLEINFTSSIFDGNHQPNQPVPEPEPVPESVVEPVPALVPEPEPVPEPLPVLVPTDSPTPPVSEADSYDDGLDDQNAVGVIAFLVFVCTIVFFCKTKRTRRSFSGQDNSSNVQSENNSQRPDSPPSSIPEAQDSQAILRSKVIKVLFPEETIDESKLKYDSDANSYRWTRDSERNSTSCCICLEGFREGDLILSGHCSHIYHRGCVMGWVEKNDSCPVCRQPIFDRATYKAVERQIIHSDV